MKRLERLKDQGVGAGRVSRWATAGRLCLTGHGQQVHTGCHLIAKRTDWNTCTGTHMIFLYLQNVRKTKTWGKNTCGGCHRRSQRSRPSNSTDASRLPLHHSLTCTAIHTHEVPLYSHSAQTKTRSNHLHSYTPTMSPTQRSQSKTVRLQPAPCRASLCSHSAQTS